MINKLIRGRIIEIIVVIVLVVCSIPIWQNFERKISSASITTADDYNLSFKVEKNGSKELLTVNNNYHINKTYKIQLELDKNVSPDDIIISINGENYYLDNFDKKEKRNKQIYTLINNYISFITNTYEIELKTPLKNLSYTYNFEESVNF